MFIRDAYFRGAGAFCDPGRADRLAALAASRSGLWCALGLLLPPRSEKVHQVIFNVGVPTPAEFLQ
jgi:hypothetical protein